jgi:uncharacterized protein YlxW (UPF0749 family)
MPYRLCFFSERDDMLLRPDGVKPQPMYVWIVALAIASSCIVSSVACFGQEPGQQQESSADSSLTREQWQQRVEEARRRAEEFVATARTRPASPAPSEKEEAEAAGIRAMNDPSLQAGDIVATGQGLVVFIGRDEEHRPEDFVPAPKPPHAR